MKKWIFLLLASLIINSCEKVTPRNTNQPLFECSLEEQNRFVYEYMQDRYFWYKYLPNVDYKNYSSVYALLEDLKYELDRWSFIIDKEILDEYFEGGEYIGYGIKLDIKDNKLYITLVYPNTPASKAGLKRGTQILEINNQPVEGMSFEEINLAFGEDRVGVKTLLKVIIDNEIKEIEITKDIIVAPSVIAQTILEIDNQKVGYFVFDRFVAPSSQELKELFSYFKAQNIDSLIVDLRYNSGGLVDVANDLVSLIKGDGLENEVSFKLLYNDKHSDENSIYYITKDSNSLNLDNIYFITTYYSCSASEAVINALKPYANVYIIGSRSCGKPVGMVGGEFCGKYLLPIEFEIVNSKDEGRYFNGLEVDCAAQDDITRDFGDEEEGMLKETIYLIKNQSCSAVAMQRELPTKTYLKLKGFKEIVGGF